MDDLSSRIQVDKIKNIACTYRKRRESIQSTQNERIEKERNVVCLVHDRSYRISANLKMTRYDSFML